MILLQDMVDALTTQNSELRNMLIKATETRTYNPDSSVENAQREDVVSDLLMFLYEPEHEKTNTGPVCPAKTPISLGIRTV